MLCPLSSPPQPGQLKRYSPAAHCCCSCDVPGRCSLRTLRRSWILCLIPCWSAATSARVGGAGPVGRWLDRRCLLAVAGDWPRLWQELTASASCCVGLTPRAHPVMQARACWCNWPTRCAAGGSAAAAAAAAAAAVVVAAWHIEFTHCFSCVHLNGCRRWTWPKGLRCTAPRACPTPSSRPSCRVGGQQLRVNAWPAVAAALMLLLTCCSRDSTCWCLPASVKIDPCSTASYLTSPYPPLLLPPSLPHVQPRRRSSTSR